MKENNHLRNIDPPKTDTPRDSVKETEISGICCSIDGFTFVADKGRQCIYRLDLDDRTSFSFGEGKLSKYNR